MHKILHIITTINRGGAENHLCELIEGLCQRGVTVGVAYLKGDGYWRDRLLACGATVYPLQLNYYGQISPLLKLRNVIKEFTPTIVHAHLPPAELYCRLALLSLFSSVPLVISKHNDEPFYKIASSDWLDRLIANRARFMIGISQAVSNYFQKKNIFPENKIKTIHYGIPFPSQAPTHEEISALRQQWLGDANGLLIMTVARLAPQKALHILIDGYALYQKQETKPSRLVIVGIGPLQSELQQLAIDKGIAEKVIFAGFRTDSQQVMYACDVFVLTSIYEGFGLVLLEAMVAKRPIVATKVSAIPEVVEDGITGILIPPLDPQKLTQAFLELESAELRSSLGMAGQQRVKNEFSVSPMVEKTLAVYQACSL